MFEICKSSVPQGHSQLSFVKQLAKGVGACKLPSVEKVEFALYKTFMGFQKNLSSKLEIEHVKLLGQKSENRVQKTLQHNATHCNTCNIHDSTQS